MVAAQILTAEPHRTRPYITRLVFLGAGITTHNEEAINRVKGKQGK